jgi:hypothetical protein
MENVILAPWAKMCESIPGVVPLSSALWTTKDGRKEPGTKGKKAKADPKMGKSTTSTKTGAAAKALLFQITKHNELEVVEVPKDVGAHVGAKLTAVREPSGASPSSNSRVAKTVDKRLLPRSWGCGSRKAKGTLRTGE